MDAQTLCTRVLEACRTELCQLYPGLNAAFALLPCQAAQQTHTGTDGSFLYTSPEILGLYAEDPAAVRRGYLHTLLHCLYGHIFPPAAVEPRLWNLACDIYCEQLISQLEEPRLDTPNAVRQACLQKLGSSQLLPPQLVRLAEKEFFPYPMEVLEEAFRFDSHHLWYTQKPEQLKRQWESAMPGGGSIGTGNRGSRSRMEEEEVSVPEHKPYDFRKYLRKYTLPREELETDTESFDYVYYHFGISHYGDLPLLEPLEYKEVWRLDELAIAIDTSGSCSRELVTRFLRETYGILSARENFFRKMKVVFFQCDCVLQDTAIIRSREMWDSYAAGLKIRGRGGTDFRPVFREIERLRQQGTLKKPKALLYFTDGDGIYPSQVPDYETVFILADENKRPDLVPKWAKKLILE